MEPFDKLENFSRIGRRRGFLTKNHETGIKSEEI
jgi:hypothetical protein